MKNKYWLILALFVITAVLFGCNRNKGNFGGFTGDYPLDGDTSYAVGMDFAIGILENMNSACVAPNKDEFLRAITDVISGSDTRFDIEKANEKIETVIAALREKREAEDEIRTVEAMQAEAEFLVENAKKPGVTMTSSGLQYEVLIEKNGQKPSLDSTVKVHYQGRLTDGTLFDNSYERQEPVEFPLYQVIPGWSEGLQLMSVGSKYRFYIPSELGYGPSGYGPIPPYSALIFEVDLLEIEN